jgi:hypothetical protein
MWLFFIVLIAKYPQMMIKVFPDLSNEIKELKEQYYTFPFRRLSNYAVRNDSA